MEGLAPSDPCLVMPTCQHSLSATIAPFVLSERVIFPLTPTWSWWWRLRSPSWSLHGHRSRRSSISHWTHYWFYWDQGKYRLLDTQGLHKFLPWFLLLWEQSLSFSDTMLSRGHINYVNQGKKFHKMSKKIQHSEGQGHPRYWLPVKPLKRFQRASSESSQGGRLP